MNFEDATDEQLLRQHAARPTGDAFATFYRRYERPVAAYHLRRAGIPDLVPDLTAETFLSALSSSSRFRSNGEGSAARWLFGIAHNVLASSARRAAYDDSRAEALGSIQRVLAQSERDALEELHSHAGVLLALEGLPPEQRDAVRGYVLDDYSYDELADASGSSAATMRKRVSRGLGVLRQQLTEER